MHTAPTTWVCTGRRRCRDRKRVNFSGWEGYSDKVDVLSSILRSRTRTISLVVGCRLISGLEQGSIP